MLVLILVKNEVLNLIKIMPPLFNYADFGIMALRNIGFPLLSWLSHGVKGLFFYIILLILYYCTLKLVFKMDRLAALDEFFLLDNAKNVSNIVTVVKTDKVPDYQHLRKTIIDLALKNDRSRHNLQKFLGEYFFVEM